MRGVLYIYPTVGDRLVIATAAAEVEISQEEAEELAAMIWHQVVPERRRAVLERTYRKHSHNFGCDGVAAELGYPTNAKMLPKQGDW